MENIFRNKADEIKIEPSVSTWSKVNLLLDYQQMVKEKNRYRNSLSIAASVAILSLLFNAMYISNFFNTNVFNDNYVANSSLTGLESGEPFHMTSKNIELKGLEADPVGRIQVKHN